jgi:hypothetical protein
LDIGCGCLRAGYWLIHFLNPRCYFGMEPNRTMLEAGIEKILEPGLIDLKRPRFDCNADFDFSIFGERFDFFCGAINPRVFSFTNQNSHTGL